MSVRQRHDKDPKTGRVTKYWMIDIKFTHIDDRVERIRKVAPVQTKRGAEQYERELRQSLLGGAPTRKEEDAPKATPIFREFAKDFIDTYAVNNNKQAEVAGKRAAFRDHLTPFFGGYHLDRIGTELLEKYKATKITKGLSPKTVNNHLSKVRKLLAVAVDWGHLDHVPAVRWMKTADPDFDFLTFEEAERLGAAADPEWRAMITTGLKTGLRIGELLGLRWQDVDLVAGKLRVRQAVSRGIIGTPKNGKSREVPLSDLALRALRLHRHLRGEFVFCDEAGKMLKRSSTKWPLYRACRRAGLRQIGWHVLRHTFASHLVMRRVPLKAVQELMGHSTIEMTMRYSHLSPDARRDAVTVLDLPAEGTMGAQKAQEG